MHSTMEDIAREAGVSTMTVSRVFSGRSVVSPATRSKVLAAAQRHNYEVNTLAQSFAQKRSGFVGIAVPLRIIGSDYFGEMMKGFDTVFGGTQLDYALFNMHSSSFEDGNRLLKLYRRRRVDGLLVVAPNVDDTFLETFAEQRFPLVVVGKTVNSSKVCWIACDDYHGITQACEHLYSLGHRRIAFVAGPVQYSVALRREQAYFDFCRRYRLELPGWYMQRGDYSVESGRRTADSFRFQSPERPTAVVAANDNMAFGLLNRLHELGLKVPEDVSVTGFDDFPIASYSYPALTTVHQPVCEMAERGARLLQKALLDDEPPTGHVVFPVSLGVQKSTAAPSSSRRRGKTEEI